MKPFLMNHKTLIPLIVSVLALFSIESVARDISVHISENGTVTTERDPSMQKVFISKDNVKKLNPNIPVDADKLSNSIEIEVFSIGENTQIHTVFQSGAGICYGYHHSGVSVIDAATYYKEGSKDEYYANISDGLVTSKGEVKNVQYASVFNIITPPELLRKVRQQDARHGKVLAEHNLKERVKVYLRDLCKNKGLK